MAGLDAVGVYTKFFITSKLLKYEIRNYTTFIRLCCIF